jgi:hypothetical protein
MAGHPSNVIRLVVSNPLLRNKEVAEFEAIPEFVEFRYSSERAQAHTENLQNLSIATHFAIIILGRSKFELIELVKLMDDHEPVGGAQLQRGLIRGRELAAAILAMMTAAEMRVAAALQVEREVNSGCDMPSGAQ